MNGETRGKKGERGREGGEGEGRNERWERRDERRKKRVTESDNETRRQEQKRDAHYENLNDADIPSKGSHVKKMITIS